MTPPRVVNMRHEACDLCIMRPNKWSNPFFGGSRENNILSFRINLLRSPLINDLHELEGLALGCCCKPLPCHGDVLVELFIERFCNGL